MPTLILNANRIRTMNKQIVLKWYSLRLRPSSVVNFIHSFLILLFAFVSPVRRTFRPILRQRFRFTILSLSSFLFMSPSPLRAAAAATADGAFTCNSCILDSSFLSASILLLPSSASSASSSSHSVPRFYFYYFSSIDFAGICSGYARHSCVTDCRCQFIRIE